jgi:2-C-methyl-D-erythritol 4-phosphate cytidylyltransferase
VVPAAGQGIRLPGKRPKQYRQLGARSVLDHAIARLLEHSAVCGVMVALASEDLYWRASEFADHAQVHTCRGGAERAESVLAGLQALHELPQGPTDHDAVLVHDAARALLPAAALQRLLRDAPGPQGALLAIPAQDTLKWSVSGDVVEKTLDRCQVWLAQTPQYFEFGRLHEALQAALDAGVGVTDEASCMEWRGGRPRLVLGDALNFKITTTADLQMAAALLENS